VTRLGAHWVIFTVSRLLGNYDSNPHVWATPFHSLGKAICNFGKKW
jgi:hypothetical protein